MLEIIISYYNEKNNINILMVIETSLYEELNAVCEI